ncbi:MAG: 16S rRNA (guanine(527)-N(7))-methyltransferase RsmG [Gammaproteobacteria bacterium]|nr:16S rRNA (guanine(527)-N(7))-methyltransferase RsmG [Gammaproteobacteria bacterium]
MQLRDQLSEGLEQIGLPFNVQQIDQLEAYLCLIQKWNQTYNLVANCRNDLLLTRHLFDCLSVLPLVAVGTPSRVLDVGSGAGLPGIPWAIFHPGSQFTLLDSNGKKTRFLFQVKVALKLENVNIEKSRLEFYQPKAPLDIIVCRAFASLSSITKRACNLMGDQTRLIALKGQLPAAELEELPLPFKALDIQKIAVPSLREERHVVTVVKKECT